ncbi:MAG: SPOR domain-containing protein [Burkholderiaceae bacterium]
MTPIRNTQRARNSQHGGTLLGFIFGLIVGLAVALALAVYVTKVPIPFLNKGLIHSSEQDASEDKKNKDWDPNAPLYGKSNKALDKDKDKDNDKTESSANADKGIVPKETDKKTEASNPLSGILGGGSALEDKDPLGDLAKAKSQERDPFNYFVQAGAFRTHEEADVQKAKLALSGFEAVVSERDQGGRSVYRVRIGPLVTKDEAEKTQQKLSGSKVDSVVIRVQK